MKTFDKTILPFFLVSILLTSCNGLISTPAAGPTNVMEIAITETQTEIPTSTPTSTPTATPSPSPLPPAETSMSASDQIVYYYFFAFTENVPPEGSVVIGILPNAFILAPTRLDMAYGSDTAADLRNGLEAVLHDERNPWTSSKLQIIKVYYSGGHADVVLQGEYFGVAPIILTAARTQILTTIFANADVQTATVTLNGDTIGNIDVSNSRDAKPADYVYTRGEIETFMAEHSYLTP